MSKLKRKSIPVTDEQLKYVNSKFEYIKKIYPDVDNDTEVIFKLLNIHDERKNYNEKIYPTEIKRAIDIINCKWFRCDDLSISFFCNEFFWNKKESKLLGNDINKVIQNCIDCKKGKIDEKQKQIEKMLTKDSIAKILTLYKSLTVLADKGLDVQIYCCTAKHFREGILIFTDMRKKIQCSLENDDVVDVDSVCLKRIDENKLKPPCRYLINLLLKTKVKDIEDIAKEFVGELPKLAQTPRREDKHEIKQVESEATIIEDEEIEDDEK